MGLPIAVEVTNTLLVCAYREPPKAHKRHVAAAAVECHKSLLFEINISITITAMLRKMSIQVDGSQHIRSACLTYLLIIIWAAAEEVVEHLRPYSESITKNHQFSSD